MKAGFKKISHIEAITVKPVRAGEGRLKGNINITKELMTSLYKARKMRPGKPFLRSKVIDKRNESNRLTDGGREIWKLI